TLIRAANEFHRVLPPHGVVVATAISFRSKSVVRALTAAGFTVKKMRVMYAFPLYVAITAEKPGDEADAVTAGDSLMRGRSEIPGWFTILVNGGGFICFLTAIWAFTFLLSKIDYFGLGLLLGF
ncbi:hypothetical protein KIPB_008125, partial [Kipferlia bialata]